MRLYRITRQGTTGVLEGQDGHVYQDVPRIARAPEQSCLLKAAVACDSHGGQKGDEDASYQEPDIDAEQLRQRRRNQ